MPRIPFVDVTFPRPDRSASAIEKRLLSHYLHLASRADRTDELALPDLWSAELQIPHDVKARIVRRTRCIADANQGSPAFRALRSEDRARIARLRSGVELVRIPSEHRADELTAALHKEFPWLGPATEFVWQAMRRAARRGDAGFRLPPLLLSGPPGIGKSTWARRLADLIGVPGLALDATGENAGFAISGCQKGWSSASMGRPLELILDKLVANPIVVIDEIEKAGIARSSGNMTYDLAASLLPLLEPGTAAKWNCPYSRLVYDMSWIGWVLTANCLQSLSAPLLSRCSVIELGGIPGDHLRRFAIAEGQRRQLSEISIEAILEALRRVGRDNRPLGLRPVIRMLDRAEVLEARRLVN